MRIRALEQASGGHWVKQNKQVGKKYGAQIPENKGGRPKGHFHILLSNAKQGDSFIASDCTRTGAYVIAKRMGAKIRTEMLLTGAFRVWVDQKPTCEH